MKIEKHPNGLYLVKTADSRIVYRADGCGILFFDTEREAIRFIDREERRSLVE